MWLFLFTPHQGYKMANFDWANRIVKPLRCSRQFDPIYNLKYMSHYKIYNEIDGYSYFGITKKSWLTRIIDFIEKRNISNSRLNSFPKWKQHEIIDETLYGNGPWATKHNRLGASILKYGFQNFTCQLLSRGAMTLEVAEAIEDEYINNSEKTYNVVRNQQPDVLPSTINKYKSFEYEYVDFRNNKFRGFNCLGMTLDRVDVLLHKEESFLNEIFQG
jgi:hypothetical protein